MSAVAGFGIPLIISLFVLGYVLIRRLYRGGEDQ